MLINGCCRLDKFSSTIIDHNQHDLNKALFIYFACKLFRYLLIIETFHYAIKYEFVYQKI